MDDERPPEVTTPMRVRRRLPMGFHVWMGVGGLLVLLAGSILVAVALIVGLTRHEERLNERAVPYASAVAAAALDAKGVANDERGFLMTGDARYVAEADRRIHSVRGWLAVSAAAASGAAQRGAVESASAGFERWVAAVRREFAAFRAGDRKGPIAASFGPGRSLRKAYEATLTRARALGASEIRSSDASVEAASSRSIAILLGWLCVALVLGVAIAWWLVRAIAVPVARLLAILSTPEQLRVIP